MQPFSNRRLLYAVLLILLSVGTFSAVAKNKIPSLFNPITLSVEKPEDKTGVEKEATSFNKTSTRSVASAPLFTTIIQGADEEVACSNNGFTIARFNLCGDFDDRAISLSGGPYGNVEWQLLGGSCTPDINEDCPNTTMSCYTTVSTNQAFNLDASTIPAGSGAEFRVIADGSQFFFKVKKSTITQTFVKRDFICGVEGRIQITNLSSSYEYSINGGNSWQPSPIFEGLGPGTYNVSSRLQNTPNTCEYPYEPIVIEQLDISMDVEFVDAQCFGDNGSITVTVNDVPGPYRYTLLDENGAAQEFTTFVSANPYTFSSVGFGTYSVQVETQQCVGDPANGIPPPIQNVDVNGTAITIGDGVIALSASTEVNESLSTEPSCGATSVNIIVRTSGGTAPYTFTVSDGGSSTGSYTTETTYTATTPGSYDFMITDANGCTIDASANVVELTPPEVTATGIDGTCTNGGAKLDIDVIDGKGYNLSFRPTSADPWSTNPLLTVPAGTYNAIEVRYQQGSFDCIYIIPTSVTVISTGTIIGNVVKIADRTCDATGGTVGGAIEFQGPFSGGAGSGYVFSISGDSPSNFTTQTSYDNLAPGTYTPIIRDSGGCRLELTPITILDIDPPTAIAFIQSDTNCATGTSDVQLTGTSTNPIVRYEIISPTYFDNAANDTFNDIDVNTAYEFRVTDSQGCTFNDSFTPAVLSSIRARVKSGADTKVCIGATDGSGTFLIDGFANTYTYNINGGIESAPQNNLEVDLPPSGVGTYQITITDTDTGCQDNVSITIIEPVPFDLSASQVTPMNCNNNNVGRVRANVTGGFGNYTYSLEDPTGTSTAFQSNRTFGNLTTGGDYILTVRDTEGCEGTFNFTLTPLTTPTINIVSSDLCFSATTAGSVTVSSSGGGSGHEYRINNGPFQTSPTFNNLVPGNYTIEIEDDNNCSAEVSITIPPQLQISLNIVNEIPCGGNGEMAISLSGGDISDLTNTSYTIFLDGTPVAGQTGVQLPSNPFNYNVPLGDDGQYTVELTDNNNCTNISPPVTFTPPANITATVNIAGPSCGDASSGFVEILPDVSTGTPPFQVVFAPGNGVLVDDPFNPDPTNTYTFSSQTIFSGLPAGDYEYIVKDDRNCTTGVQSITINPDTTNPPDATVSSLGAVCSLGAVSGGIRIDAIADGVPNFVIIIEDNFGNEIIRRENVAPADLPLDINDPLLFEGNYTIITLDSRGCTDQDAVNINSTDLDIVPDFMVTDDCAPGILPQCVDIVNGVGPFDIRLVTDPPSAYVDLAAGVRRHCFPDLVPGASYTVEVLDEGTGCTYLETVMVPNETNPLDVALSIDNGNCNGDNVELEYVINGAIGPFDIIVRNLDTGVIVTDVTGVATTNATFLVPQGPYAISVIDNLTNCVGADTIEATLNMPRVDVISNENANCLELGQLTVRGSGGTPYPPSGAGSLPDGSAYEYAFVDAGTLPVAGDYVTETTIFLPGSLGGMPYDIWVRDARGCEFMTSATVVQLDANLPEPTITVDNQCNGTIPAGGFEIELTMPAVVINPTFTLGGQTQIPVYDPNSPTTAVFNVGSNIGVFDVRIVDINGCDVTTTAEVYQILTSSGSFTTDPSCEDSDGIISVNVNGGSGDFTLELTGTDFNGTAVGPTTQTNDDVFTGANANTVEIFSNLAPGTYEVLVTDNRVTGGGGMNCTTMVTNIIADTPIQPNISDTGISNITCNDGNPDNGSIDVSLTAGTDVDGIQEYNLYNGSLPLAPSPTPIATNNSGSFTDLAAGNYVVQVVTDRGCTDEENVTITEPPVFEITATAPDFACEPGVNSFSSTVITVSIFQPGTALGGYQYSITGFENYQSGDTFEIIDNGLPQDITVYAIDGNGCQSTFTLPTINPPTDVVPTLSVENELNCVDPERIRIDVTGTTNFTIITNSVTPVANVDVVGASFGFVDLPESGDYLIEIMDNTGGCTYPLPKHEVESPIIPTINIAEAKPVSCAMPGNDGELSIEVTDYAGTYSYEVFAVDNLGNETTTGITGNLDTSNNPETIAGLTGGNFVVRIISTLNPFCSNLSNLATIRTPNGPLVPDAIEIGNVSCDNNIGKIAANLTGGYDTFPYEYRLLLDADNDATYETEIVAWGASNEFENLVSGDYRVEYRDIENCNTSFDITLDAVLPIQAGIREPQALVCPDGNNAVLEAFDPTTGDAVTATPGATGGVSGAGYLYQLIYLGSDDITDETSRSGLQDSPTFIGANGGFISEGYYAIEVSSSFGCLGVTIPYYVNPPPPVIPNLVQVQAPGCGGLGQMRLTITNPEVGFEYEYRLSEAAGGTMTDPFFRIEDPTGNASNSVLIDGVANFYQYEVRKINATNTCGVINSNGLTLVDAQDIDLVVNQPDDISCASETDGRIESFSSGGVGNNTYTLYLGDPVDAFSPSATATIVASNDFGTFEGLSDATNYYIAVTSGATCQDIEGPYEVARPEPIVFEADSTPISCNGERDGTITVDVTSGGEGLLQFAIGPNFNEFFSDPDNPTTYTFEDLEGDASGREYQVLIQDSQGCSELAIVRVFEPEAIQISSVETPEICLGFADGTAQLTISGGTPFVDAMGATYYETSLNSNEDADFVRNDNLLFENLSGGETYIIFVRDANGCEENIVITIEIGVNIMAEAIVEYGCDGIFPNSTARVELQDEAALSEVLFSLDVDDITMASTERMWGDLPAGDHIVYIYHENGCTTMVEFTIDFFEPLVLEVQKTGEDEITAIASGGFGGYEFFFQGESTGEENVFDGIASDIDITVRVVDEKGCVVEMTFPFIYDVVLDIPGFFTPDGDGFNDEWFPRNREFFPNIDVIIYDRYGRVVATLNQVTQWDGKYESNDLPTGDYWYVVNANDSDKQQYVGHFTLIR